MNRLKSKVLWVSIASVLFLFLNQLGILNNLQMDALKNLVDVVLTGLVVFGILNNPTTPDKF